MRRNVDHALAHCIELMRQGQQDLEGCLALYPEHRQELERLLPLVLRLSDAPPVQPTTEFRRAARQRLRAKLVPQGPARVTFFDRLRMYVSRRKSHAYERRRNMSWALITALVLALLGGGGAGVAYAADGSSPGSALHGLDLTMESLRFNLASSGESRAELALAFAEERLLEAQTLIESGGAQADIQQAVDGYGLNVSQAAAELASVASGGDEASSQALANLLQTSLSIHSQALAEAKANVPESAQPYLDQALLSSEAGKLTVESIFSGGTPGGAPESLPGAPAEERELPGGRPDEVPGGKPEDDAAGYQGAGSFESRVAGLGPLLDEVQADFAAGRTEQAEAGLVSYEGEVESLAQELAAVAEDDSARAQALAALLTEALSIHAEILSQLLDQVPESSAAFVEGALDASEVGSQRVIDLFAEGMPGITPGSVPGGQP